MIVWKTADDNIPHVHDVVMVTREGRWSSALAPRLVLPKVWQNRLMGSSVSVRLTLLFEKRGLCWSQGVQGEKSITVRRPTDRGRENPAEDRNRFRCQSRREKEKCLRKGFAKPNFGLWDFPAAAEKTMQSRNGLP
jgi:hypothetical protein